jgi:hypothetical protein
MVALTQDINSIEVDLEIDPSNYSMQSGTFQRALALYEEIENLRVLLPQELISNIYNSIIDIMNMFEDIEPFHSRYASSIPEDASLEWLIQNGYRNAEIANHFEISRSTLWRYKQELDLLPKVLNILSRK